MKDIEKAINNLGWDVEIINGFTYFSVQNRQHFRAEQGNFKTAWRPDIKQVLSDVQKIVDCRKEADKAKLPF